MAIRSHWSNHQPAGGHPSESRRDPVRKPALATVQWVQALDAIVTYGCTRRRQSCLFAASCLAPDWMPDPTLESLLLLAFTVLDYRRRLIGRLRPAVTGWHYSQAPHVTVGLAEAGPCGRGGPGWQ